MEDHNIGFSVTNAMSKNLEGAVGIVQNCIEERLTIVSPLEGIIGVGDLVGEELSGL